MGSSRTTLLILALAAGLAVACDDGPGPGLINADDGAGGFDLAVKSDATTDPDTTGSPDTVITLPDAVAEDEGPPPTDTTEAHTFGWPCTVASECFSGYCVGAEAGTAGQCSQVCTDQCPKGYGCQGQTSPAGIVFLCVPLDAVGCIKTCFHPNTFQDCGVPGALCADIGGKNFCVERCETTADCPFDFSCVQMKDDDGFPLGRQCVPDSDSCECGTDVDVLVDPNNCGSCGHACEYAHAVPLCQAGTCAMGPCEAGWSDLTGGVADGCEYPCSFAPGEDLPDASLADTDCDGIDGTWGRSVFVSPAGTDADNDDGTPDFPFRTIQKAIDFADKQVPKKVVIVAAGTYIGQVKLRAGVHVAGGYDSATWQRDPVKYKTVILGDGLEPSGAIRAIVADGITEATRLSGVIARTVNNPAPGGSTQAIWIRNCSPALEIVANRFEPGAGGAGQDGIAGESGSDGVDGAPGGTGGPENYWKPEVDVLGGQGGDNVCPNGINTSGGRGGQAGWGDSPLFASEKKATAGEPAPAGAAGGPAGGKKNAGTLGQGGGDGTAGENGAAGEADGFVNALGFWVASSGGDGTNGTNGGGGGGAGGGGGGKETGDCVLFGIGCEHSHGGGGGGGGSGGCAGTGGRGGTGGGGSFGIFLAGGGPTIKGNTVVLAAGGTGGLGGKAGLGGKTGYGGEKGSGYGTAGDGGWGGKGGKGARGGYGGGGGGGPSFGIYIVPGSNPTCGSNSMVGAPTPGAGGASTGLAGKAGLAGAIGPSVPAGCKP